MGPVSYGEALLAFVRAGLGWTTSKPLKSCQLLSKWMLGTRLLSVRGKVFIKKTGCTPERAHHRALSEGSVPCSRVPYWHTFQLFSTTRAWTENLLLLSWAPYRWKRVSWSKKVKYKLQFGKSGAHLHICTRRVVVLFCGFEFSF